MDLSSKSTTFLSKTMIDFFYEKIFFMFFFLLLRKKLSSIQNTTSPKNYNVIFVLLSSLRNIFKNFFYCFVLILKGFVNKYITAFKTKINFLTVIVVLSCQVSQSFLISLYFAIQTEYKTW